MTKQTDNKNLLSFKKHNLIAILDGLDLFLNFSIITHLCIFFFSGIDGRVSIIISSSLILISFFSRLFSLYFHKIFFSVFKKNEINFFLSISVIYLFPLIPLDNYLVLFLILFSVSRFFIGIFISQANLCYLFSDKFKENEIFFVKYFIFFILGMFLGSVFYLFIDDIFSNDDLNQWAWKIIYLILFILTFTIGFFLNYKKQIILIKYNISDNRVINSSYGIFYLIAKNLFILIPIFLFIIFSSSEWFPKFSNPENMQFLNFNLINIVLVILTTLFIYPLILLIGKRKAASFLSISILFFSLIACFFEYDSSYSINFLKFFLSIVSSFSICLYYLDSKLINEFNPYQKIKVFNSFFLVISFLIPLSFYYFINFSISYNVVYLIIFLIYLFSYLMEIYGRKKI